MLVEPSKSNSAPDIGTFYQQHLYCVPAIIRTRSDEPMLGHSSHPTKALCAPSLTICYSVRTYRQRVPCTESLRTTKCSSSLLNSLGRASYTKPRARLAKLLARPYSSMALTKSIDPLVWIDCEVSLQLTKVDARSFSRSVFSLAALR